MGRAATVRGGRAGGEGSGLKASGGLAKVSEGETEGRRAGGVGI